MDTNNDYASDIARQARQKANGSNLDHVPFTDTAYESLKTRIATYIEELIREAIKTAKREQSDVISAIHVERASTYLVSSTSRRFSRHIGTIGGIILGGSISNVLAIIGTDPRRISTIGGISTTVLLILGAFLVAFHIAKD